MGNEDGPAGSSGRSADRRVDWLALTVAAAVVVMVAACSGDVALPNDGDLGGQAGVGHVPSAAGDVALPDDSDFDSTTVTDFDDSDPGCATSESIPEESRSFADPGSEGSLSPSDWLALPRDPPTGEGPTAEELSTGPRLRWTEIAAGPEETLGFDQKLRLVGTSVGGGERISLESLGDGRVLAIVRDHDAARYFVTSDGTAWTELPTPEGIRAVYVRGSGSTWAVVGYGAQEETEREDPNGAASSPYAEFRAFASDDDGARWTEVELDLGPGTPHVIDQFLHPSALLVSGDCIVVPVVLSRQLDWSSLLADRRLIADGRLAACWPHTEDSVLRCLEMNPDLEDEIASEAEEALLEADEALLDPLVAADLDRVDILEMWETVTEVLDELPDIASLEVAVDELDLTEDQQAVLMMHVGQIDMLAMLSEESPPRFGIPGGLGGFADLLTTRVLVGGRSGLVPSADLQGQLYSSLTTPAGFLLHFAGTTNSIASSPDGRHWREIPVGAPPPLYAVSFTIAELFSTVQPLGGVTADGTVWGRAWADEGGLAITTLRVGEAPRTVTVFEGLEPGRRLEDMAAGPAGLATAATRSWVDEEDQYHDRTLVGWSADGAQWGWQSTAEAFGISDEYLGEMAVAVEMAVGADFVLALMEDNQDFASYPLRWFIAPIPSQR